MSNNGKKFAEKCSRGVHTSETHLPPSSTITESDSEMMRQIHFDINSNDGDQSAVSIDEVYQLPKNFETDTSSDLDLYRMKILSRKGLKDHPSRVEFHLAKPKVGVRRDRNVHKRHEECRCHNISERANVPKIVKIPSQCEQMPDQVQSDSSSEQYRPMKFRGRLRNMFPWFRQQSSNCSKLNQHDVEAAHENEEENADFYHFDHGSPLYYRTTDCPPHLVSDIIAQRTTFHATKFWAEVFGSINIGVTFFVTFFLQFYRFILYSLLRAIIVGFLQTTSDYLLKPMLAVIFNGFLQPQLTFTHNIFQSICDTLTPLIRLIESALRPFTECIRAFRIVEIKNLHREKRDEKAPAGYQSYQGQSTA